MCYTVEKPGVRGILKLYEELKREKKKLEDMIETGYENLTNEKILKQSEILDKLIAAYQKLNMQNFKHKE